MKLRGCAREAVGFTRVKLAVETVRARLRVPFAAAWGNVRARDLLLVRLEDADGTVGWGEAAPLRGYDGVGLPEVRAALETYIAVFARAEVSDHEEILGACAAAAGLPPALAVIDLALWDLEGRRSGLPVWRLLSDARSPPRVAPAGDAGATGSAITRPSAHPPEVVVNATIASEDPAEVSAAVAQARSEGFPCVKVKVAVGEDRDRLAAARSSGGENMALRIDANGAWSVEEAVAALEALAPFRIELCEEPVHGLESIARVATASSVPIALDETARATGALVRRVCDAACLKVAHSGGISGLLHRAAEARAAGYRVYLASTLDGPLGIAAALHAAAAVAPELPCGLATLPLFANRLDPLPARGGRIAVPSGPGLGDGLLHWYRELSV